MTTASDGSTTIEFLLARNRLETVDGSSTAESAAIVIGRAARRLITAQGGLAHGDVEGAFVAAYDGYRMAAEALLIRQGLRATGGDGSHVTVEDAISAQFSRRVPEFAKPTFERLRRTRHAAQYFDPSAVEIDVDDAAWALATAQRVVDTVQRLLADDPPALFT